MRMMNQLWTCEELLRRTMKGSTSPHPLGACGAECKYQVAFLMKFHPDTFVPDPKKTQK